MNIQTLSHPTVIKNILKAMRLAQKQGIEHVRNRYGNAYLAVRYANGKFTFMDAHGVDCGLLVYRVVPSAIAHRVIVKDGTEEAYNVRGQIVTMSMGFKPTLCSASRVAINMRARRQAKTLEQGLDHSGWIASPNRSSLEAR